MFSCVNARLKCDCNELCFFYYEIREVEKDNSKINRIIVNKCNRITEEGSKKKPCKFYNEKIIEEKNKEQTNVNINVYNNNNNNNKEPVVTYKEIRENIYKMFEVYNIKITNYFAKLNKYLHILGYSAHDPLTESLSELKYRFNNPPNKKKILYNYSKETQLTKTVEEHDFNYEEDSEILERIKNKIDPLEWAKNDTIKFFLKSPIIKSKVKSKLKSKKIKTVLKENLEDLVEEVEEVEESEEELEDDEEENEEELDKNKDNEFDVEQESDDDDYDDNNDYEDFSD